MTSPGKRGAAAAAGLGMLLAAAVWVAFARYFSPSDIAFLPGMVAEHYLVAVALYGAVYFLATLLALPATILLTMAGGFLFGAVQGSVYTMVCSTGGSLAVFLAARYMGAGPAKRRYRGKMESVGKELRANGVNYLLALRLMPFMPYHFVNISAGVAGVRAYTFLWTTVAGTLPGTVILSVAGSRVRNVGDMGRGAGAEFTAILLLLAVFAVLPVAVRKLRIRAVKRTGGGDHDG